MLKDTTVIRFRQPDAIDDPLTELAREGARRMLAQALIAEADRSGACTIPSGRMSNGSLKSSHIIGM
jgi:hypothetical protein